MFSARACDYVVGDAVLVLSPFQLEIRRYFKRDDRRRLVVVLKVTTAITLCECAYLNPPVHTRETHSCYSEANRLFCVCS